MYEAKLAVPHPLRRIQPIFANGYFLPISILLPSQPTASKPGCNPNPPPNKFQSLKKALTQGTQPAKKVLIPHSIG